jgi:hypothetical protein
VGRGGEGGAGERVELGRRTGWPADFPPHPSNFAPGKYGSHEAQLNLYPPDGITPEQHEKDRRRITGYRGPMKKKAGCQGDLIDHNADEVGA